MYKIINIEKTASTNQYVRELIENKQILPDTIVVADEQTSGRGQGDNVWLSEPGSNLTFSLYVKIIQKADTQAWLSKAVALGLCDFVGLYSQTSTIKWPNDILAKGKKIIGVLIEHNISGQNLSGSIIGIGVNVNQELFPAELNAISLREITGAMFKIPDTLKTLTVCLKTRIMMYEHQKWTDIDADYHSKLLGYGKECAFRLKNGKEIQAIHRGVDPLGRIILETAGVEKNYFDVQEVKWVGIL